MPNAWISKAEILGENIEEEIARLEAEKAEQRIPTWQPIEPPPPSQERPWTQPGAPFQPVEQPSIEPSRFEPQKQELQKLLIPEEAPPVSVPFWQRALQVFAAPFEWVQQNVINPALSIGLGVFTPDLEREPGEDYFDWKRREWEAWKSPGFNLNVPWSEEDWRIDVRGVSEFAPWFLIPGAGQVGGGMIKGASALGRLAPVAKAVGQAIRYSPWGLVERGMGATASRLIRKLGKESARVSKAVSDRLYGKIDPIEAQPVIRKFTGFFQEHVGPKLVEKRAIRKAQLSAARGRMAQAERDYAAGKISVDELSKLRSAARAGAAEFPTIPKEVIKFEPGEVRQLKELIEKKLTSWEAQRAQDALDNLLSQGIVPQKAQVILLKRALGEEFGEAISKFVRQPASTTRKILEVANAPRAILASWDVSATARQGLILSLLHPTKVPKTFVNQLKAFASEKLSLQMDDIMRASPDFDDFVKHGGYMAPLRPEVVMALRAEPYFSKIAQKLPMVRRSERAYVTYLNQMRFGAWQSTSKAWKAMGAGDKDLTGLAKLINVFSGRGNLPKNWEGIAPMLSAFMFSPRLQMSRLQLLKMATDRNPYVRREAWKGLGLLLGAGASLLTLLDLSGVSKVELDPRSADFGKIKIGETRFDMWTGYQQYVRFAAQMLTGERKTSYGNMTKVGRDEVAWRFAQSKASPAWGLVVDLFRGENYMGEELFTDTTGAIRQAKNRFLPLAIQDMWDSFETGGVNNALIATPAFIGVGVLTYTSDLKKARNNVARAMGAENWDELDPKTQRELERTSPELQRAIKEYDRQVMGTQWGDWRLAGNAVEDVFRENVEDAVAQYRETKEGYTFREKVSDAFTARRGGYSARSADPRFEEIVTRMETPQTLAQIAELGPEQMAIRIYTDALYGDDMYDEFGDYRFDLMRERREQIRQQLGDDLFNYVEQYRGLKYEDFPQEFQELAQAKIVMRPYWEVRTEAERIFGVPKTKWAEQRLERFISRTRERLRRTNRNIAYYYEMFYKRT